MNYFKKQLLVALGILITTAALAQSEKDREKIRQSNNQQELLNQQDRLQAKYLKDSTDVSNYLKAHPKARREFTRRGVHYKMVRISKNGNPIYLKTKMKK